MRVHPAILPAFVAVGIAVSVTTRSLGSSLHEVILPVTLALGSLPLIVRIARSLIRREFGVDIIAIAAISTSFFVQEYLAGTVILLMLSGGEALEAFALRRARRDLKDLVERFPSVAHRIEEGVVIDVPIASVVVGDIVLIKTGEMIPVDGVVEEGSGSVDASFLTGESVPLRAAKGRALLSGSIALDQVLTLRVTRPPSESAYQQIIALIERAEREKAPFVRLADRYSVVFTGAAFVLAVLAWGLSGDPVRLLAVLVVATPCPLILAAPVAFSSGISRAARLGIIVRSGGSFEKLGEIASIAFDKTGTLTLGEPVIASVSAFGATEEEVLRLAASLDQLSSHVLARAIVERAKAASISLEYPENFVEVPGEGVRGRIGGKNVALGRLVFLRQEGFVFSPEALGAYDDLKAKGGIVVLVGSEEKIVGAIECRDAVRPGSTSLVSRLHALGIKHVRMLTGDRRPAALEAARAAGIPEEDVLAECLPEEKVREVQRLRELYPPVAMVGDGVNDAPAIAVADVGIAMGGRGLSASSQAGDIVILMDKIERVVDALSIGKRVLAIARESVIIGMTLSIFLMVVAAAGFIEPLYGALLQEIIDVAVILNALRARR